jgi:hypothetical protein
VATDGLDRDLLTEIEDYINTQLSNFREEIIQLQRQVEALMQVVAPGTDIVAPLPKDNGLVPSTSEIPILKSSIDDIENQDSQSDILNALVNRSTSFAPRTALFVLKNEHVVGWRSRGFEHSIGNDAIREIALPLSSDTVVSSSLRTRVTLSAQPGINSDDEILISQLGTTNPHRMVSIPLFARGKAVAVLYADSGSHGPEAIKLEALEILSRVAGMAVDLLAVKRVDLRHAQPQTTPETRPEVQLPPVTETTATETVEAPVSFETLPEPVPVKEPLPEVVEPQPFAPAVEITPQPEPAAFTPEPVPIPVQEPTQDLPPTPPIFSTPTVVEEPDYRTIPVETPPPVATPEPYELPVIPPPQVTAESIVPAPEPQSVFNAIPEPAPAAPSPIPSVPIVPPLPPVVEPEPAIHQPAFTPPMRPPQIQTGPLGSARRYGRAEPDLPIDVPEEEKRAHNDARRFARLLVSEIKLYNEQRVKDGRDAGDLYSRLREDIDRSRQMYEKRVAPHVASTFDYFHFELVNTLAEGDPNRMGRDYPGESIKK